MDFKTLGVQPVRIDKPPEDEVLVVLNRSTTYINAIYETQTQNIQHDNEPNEQNANVELLVESGELQIQVPEHEPAIQENQQSSQDATNLDNHDLNGQFNNLALNADALQTIVDKPGTSQVLNIGNLIYSILVP